MSLVKEHDTICLLQSFCLKYSWLKINTEMRAGEERLKRKGTHSQSLWFGRGLGTSGLLACAIQATSHLFVCLLPPMRLVLMMVQDTSKASCLDSPRSI